MLRPLPRSALQAMGLEHDGYLEVACNLLDTSISSPAAVQQRVCELAMGEGLQLGRSYRIGKTPEQILQEAAHQLALQ